MLVQQLALFAPFSYVILGEIIPSRSGKMRLKFKTLVMLSLSVGLVALGGYFYRGSGGEGDYNGRLSAQGPLVGDDFVRVPGHVRQKQDATKHRVIEDEIGKNVMSDEGKGKKHWIDDKMEEKVPPPAPRKVRKVFPDPISLKPQGPKPDGERQNLPHGAPVKEKVPQPPVQLPQPPGNGQLHRQQAPQPPAPQPPAQKQAQPAQPPAQKQAQPAQPPGINDKPHQPQDINHPRPGQETANINQARLDAAKKIQMALMENMKQQSQHASQHKQEVNQAVDSGKQPGPNSVINLSVVCCGDRTDETVVMLKTATILTQQNLYFHIFAEDNLQAGIAQRLDAWPAVYRRKIQFDLRPISFPPGEDPEKWKKVFKMCATQRLFLPDLLPHVDSLLYVDTDILFIRPIEEIYSFFKQFNSTQMAAMTPEHEVKNIGWYNRFARHPYYGETGMNSGVMLMNLTRMRQFGWTKKIVPIYHEYKLKITWGDQDLINIVFHDYPQGLFPYTCEWNYRPDHCMYSNNCRRTDEHGIAVIHGNRGVYHNEKQLAFRAIYESFRDYTFGADLEMGLIQPLTQQLNQPSLSKNYCAQAVLLPVTSTLKKYVNKVIPIKTPV
nr:glucoside xylosyltransferase 1-like [Lytechinus pictus]